MANIAPLMLRTLELLYPRAQHIEINFRDMFECLQPNFYKGCFGPSPFGSDELEHSAAEELYNSHTICSSIAIMFAKLMCVYLAWCLENQSPSSVFDFGY
jgi:hypothetical protein